MTYDQIELDTSTVQAVRCPNVVPTSQVMAVMRLCGPEMGLSAQVLRSLEVLQSCLAPKRNHHVVFASKATLVYRAGGLSDRSLRRHIAALVGLGLVERADSANGKRYCRHNPEAGLTIPFGLNFAKLFERMPELSLYADQVAARNQTLRHLRCKLRATAQRILRDDTESEAALTTLKALRRSLTESALEAMQAHLNRKYEASPRSIETEFLTGDGGQNDRQQSVKN